MYKGIIMRHNRIQISAIIICLYAVLLTSCDSLNNQPLDNQPLDNQPIDNQPIDNQPIDQIRDLTATPDGDNRVTLSWINPEDPKFSYVEIDYTPNIGHPVSPMRMSKTDFGSGTTITQTITDLVSGTEYLFTVTAFNDLGMLMDEEQIRTIPIDATAPSPVSNLSALAGPTEATLDWTNPSDDDFAYVEVAYVEVGCVPMNDDPCMMMTTRVPATGFGTAGAPVTTTITGLKPIAEYTFEVTAYDQATPPNSSTVSAMTDTIPPGPVTDIRVQARPTAVTLDWRNPSDDNFAYVEVAYVEIGCVSMNGDPCMMTIIKVPATGVGTAGAPGTTTITELTPLTEYMFEFTAYDQANPQNSSIVSPLIFGLLGTANNPYLIDSPEALMSIGGGLSDFHPGGNTIPAAESLAAHYRVIADIDLSSIKDIFPIGSSAAPFSGTFDGGNRDGFEIRNLTMNGTNTRGKDYQGLFGLVGGTIRNVTLRNATVTGFDHVGGLVGTLGINDQKFGALPGLVSNSAVIGGTITGKEGTELSKRRVEVGGLVGTMEGGFNISTITNSYATANVMGDTSSNDKIGGLVGYQDFRSTITNSYATGDVDGNVGDDDDVGRLVGDNNGSSVPRSSYYSSDAAITNGTAGSRELGVGRTLAELQRGIPDPTIYRDWDTTIWDFGDDTTLPTIRSRE